jgi:hypothetical protein
LLSENGLESDPIRLSLKLIGDIPEKNETVPEEEKPKVVAIEARPSPKVEEITPIVEETKQEKEIGKNFDIFLMNNRNPKDLKDFWKKNSPIVAQITKVDELGLVSVAYSKPLFKRDKHLYDTTAMKLFIIPNIQVENVTVLGFDFECQQMESTFMKIQLKFDNPRFISYEGTDWL